MTLHPRQPPLRLAAFAAATVAAFAAMLWYAGDEAPPAPVAATASAPAAAMPPTRSEAPFPSLSLALLDVSPDSAVIAVGPQQGSYTVGQDVFPGIVLDRIGTDSVTLRFGTQLRILSRVPGTGPATTATASKPVPAEPPRIDTRQLTSARPMAAEAFLNEVRVHPGPRGGFVVDSVVPDGRYDRMGLRPGDVIYTLDTPAMRAVDEGSMVALMQQTELELDIYRGGTQQRLRVALNVDDEAAHTPK